MRPDAASIEKIAREARVEATVADETFGVVCRVAPEDVRAVLGALKTSGYDMLVDLFGTDTGEAIDLTYHLRSLERGEDAYVRVETPYDGEVQSASWVYPASLYPEREIAELLGVSFPGHPNPKRLLTSDEVDGYLLRKSCPVRTHEEVSRHDEGA